LTIGVRIAQHSAMDDQVSGEDIARIEAHIEELGEAIERCRKFSLAAKITIAAGAGWIALSMLSVVSYTPETTLTALAAIIIGIVLLGSNRTTWRETESALRASEAMRADMIGRLDMRMVGEQTPTLH
jgi:hypothetical protein